MLDTIRTLARAALGVCALATLAAAFQAPAQRVTFVAVWGPAGELITEDLKIAATGAGGTVLGELEAGSHFALPGAGSATPYGMKTTLEVVHPVYGVQQLDLSLAASPVTTLDLVFDLDGKLGAYGSTLLELPSRAAGFAGGTPGNDLCANATPLALGQTSAGSTLGATFDDVGTCGTTNTAPGVWFTVNGNGAELTATTCSPGSTFDTKISVFCGGCDDLSCIAGNDDDCDTNALLSTVSWCSQPGATYYVLVHGFNTEVGDFELTVTEGDVCSGATACENVGACCVDDVCFTLTEAACANLGGEYQGDFTECNTLVGARDFHSGTLDRAIPDNDPAGTRHTLTVPNTFDVADVNLTVTIDHTFTGDLQVFLAHYGTEVLVIDRPGVPALSIVGCPEDDWNGVTLDDEGSGGPIENQCLLGGGLSSPPAYTPNNPLSAFDGMSSFGAWSIRVVDNANLDAGSLVSWTLTLSKGDGTTICSDDV